MKIYSTGNQAIWLLIGFFAIALLLLIGMGSFLLGTPLGLAILTLLVIRHFYKKYRYKRAYENMYGDFDSETGRSQMQWDFSQTPRSQSTDKTDQFERKNFSRDEAVDAEDVDFKEIK